MSFLFKLSLLIFIFALITFGFSYYLKNNLKLNEVKILNTPTNQDVNNSQEVINQSINQSTITQGEIFSNNEVKIIHPIEERKNRNITIKQEETEQEKNNEEINQNELDVKEITINASEFKFEPNIFTVKENQQVKLIVKNIGNIPHNLKIEKENIIYQTSLIAPGEEAILEFKAPPKGEYDFYCTLDNHKLKGMFGKMIVE